MELPVQGRLNLRKVGWCFFGGQGQPSSFFIDLELATGGDRKDPLLAILAGETGLGARLKHQQQHVLNAVGRLERVFLVGLEALEQDRANRLVHGHADRAQIQRRLGGQGMPLRALSNETG